MSVLSALRDHCARMYHEPAASFLPGDAPRWARVPEEPDQCKPPKVAPEGSPVLQSGSSEWIAIQPGCWAETHRGIVFAYGHPLGAHRARRNATPEAHTRLPFEIDGAFDTSLVTGRLRVPVAMEFFCRLGGAATIEAQVVVKQHQQGLRPCQLGEALIALWVAGG